MHGTHTHTHTHTHTITSDRERERERGRGRDKHTDTHRGWVGIVHKFIYLETDMKCYQCKLVQPLLFILH